ncbi:MAG TPA: MraY family glycosyltransferase [Trebonia sp.]|jgi:UDP-GlcNAc:undecaprenyl-phosphate GlcNAc-1-phosphate transferase|nr:MraY family glycosyltransferase [Trebonia sp.]
MRDYLFILIIAAAVTYLLTPVVRLFAKRINAQHEARDRDVHKEPTPLIGGLAMYGGMAAALLVAERLTYLQQAFPSSRTVNGLLAAGGLLVIIGIIDDRFGMSPLQKAAGQVAAGGILAWSGTYLPWLPLPNGESLVLEPDLSYTVTILLIVITINAVNFIDGLDGLAAGVVGIAGLAFFIYSYTLSNSLHLPSQSVPAVASAVLVGICVGFLPHNFNPARIFMGDTGAMLLGLLLAYGPISSTLSLDPSVLRNYSLHPLNRFPQILPILLPLAILVIPYTDLSLAVIRRTAQGKSPFSPDRKHLHHRLLNMGHSHRQSVLLMYLWAALFSGAVVGLSVIRIQVVWLAAVTVAALIALVLATIPQWRPWRTANGRRGTLNESGEISDRVAYAGSDPRTVNGLSPHGVLAPPATVPPPSSNALVDPTESGPAIPAGDIKKPPSSVHR